MAQNLIRLKQLNTTELSGFFASTLTNTGAFVNLFSPHIVYTDANQNISGNKTFVNGNVNFSGNNINFSGNNINFENQNNINLAYQFPGSTGIRRYAPLDLFNTTSVIPVSGTINYLPFLIKKKISNPVACVEMTVYSTFDPKVTIGIYDGRNGFENANLIASGSITGNSLGLGIYRTTLNGTFNQGPYIIASILESGAGSTFRVSSSNGFREHFGINTGSSTLFGGTAPTVLTNALGQTGASILPQNIGSGVWYGTAANVLSPLVFLEY
jgi:hypothetical protein